MKVAKPDFLEPIIEKIPDELKSIPQWVVWRAESRGGKLTKVPYNAKQTKKPGQTTQKPGLIMRLL